MLGRRILGELESRSRTLAELRLAVKDALPAAVMGGLERFGVGFPAGVERSDAMDQGWIDEIRVPTDWLRFPTTEPIRVLGLWTSTGAVIRWRRTGSPIGDLHEDLVFKGDDITHLVSGYVQVNGEELVVQSSGAVGSGFASEPLKGEHQTGSARFIDWVQGNAVPVIAASIVSLGVLILGIAAYFNLDPERRIETIAEVARLSFQLFAIVIAGALIKLAIDNSKDWSERRKQHRELQMAYVRRMIDASHLVDIARLQILANRSVKTWSQQNDKLIQAYVDLRDIQHDILTIAESSAPVFYDWEGIRPKLDLMVAYLGALIAEYGENKKRLSEVQRAAEASSLDRSERHLAQAKLWENMQQLHYLGDFIGTKHSGAQADFRSNYRSALELMRANVAGRHQAPTAIASPS